MLIPIKMRTPIGEMHAGPFASAVVLGCASRASQKPQLSRFEVAFQLVSSLHGFAGGDV